MKLVTICFQHVDYMGHFDVDTTSGNKCGNSRGGGSNHPLSLTCSCYEFLACLYESQYVITMGYEFEVLNCTVVGELLYHDKV